MLTCSDCRRGPRWHRGRHHQHCSTHRSRYPRGGALEMPDLSFERQCPPTVPSGTHRPASVHVSGRETPTVSVALHDGNRRSCAVRRDAVAHYCNLPRQY